MSTIHMSIISMSIKYVKLHEEYLSVCVYIYIYDSPPATSLSSFWLWPEARGFELQVTKLIAVWIVLPSFWHKRDKEK